MYTMKLYPYNSILLFHHILVLHNHTKTDTYLRYDKTRVTSYELQVTSCELRVTRYEFKA